MEWIVKHKLKILSGVLVVGIVCIGIYFINEKKLPNSEVEYEIKVEKEVHGTEETITTSLSNENTTDTLGIEISRIIKTNQLGEEPTVYYSSGIYYILEMTIENKTNNEQLLLDPYFLITSESGATFKPQFIPSQKTCDTLLNNTKIISKGKATGCMIFDVSEIKESLYFSIDRRTTPILIEEYN